MNVFRNGKGKNLNLDNHRFGPYGTLFSNINLGSGTRYSLSSGTHKRGDHAGSYTTFWNVYANSHKTLSLPSDENTKWIPRPRKWGTLLNFVGAFKTSNVRDGWYVENIDNVNPPDLYDGMIKLRTSRK
jgi:hypothetical protein